MDRDPMELRSIDPRADTQRWDALVRRVNSAAAPELRRRAAGAGGVMFLTAWTRPILAVAAVLAVVSVAVFRTAGASVEVASVTSVAEALGFPMPVADWLAEDRAPAEADLLLALERRVER
jgi:hypothetical protein